MKKILRKSSLQKLPFDKRDFPLGGVFGITPIEEVPITDFIVATPLIIKDQGDTDYCSAYASTSVSEDQEGVELLPGFQFFQTKQISGDPEEWGANLRDVCKSFVKVGSIIKVGNESFENVGRGLLLDKTNWPNEFNIAAIAHRKSSFFCVDGKEDIFDNIRAALWDHKDEKCTILTGALFRMEWLNASGGIIPESYGNDGFGHAFKLFGQKTINGELYIMAQLSEGIEVGDKGIFYFPRSVVNKEIGQYGIYMFKDMSKEDAEFYLENNLSPKTSFLGSLLKIIISFFTGK